MCIISAKVIRSKKYRTCMDHYTGGHPQTGAIEPGKLYLRLYGNSGMDHNNSVFFICEYCMRFHLRNIQKTKRFSEKYGYPTGDLDKQIVAMEKAGIVPRDESE